MNNQQEQENQRTWKDFVEEHNFKFALILGIISITLILFYTFTIPTPLDTNKINIYQASCSFGDPMKSCNETEEINQMEFPDRNVTKDMIDWEFLDKYCQEIQEDTYACKKYLIVLE